MIVKDSTTNQVHNDSKNTKQTPKKVSIKRLRSDASESGAHERAPPVEKTSQIQDRQTDTGVSDSHATEACSQISSLIFWS